jgi:DNA polymerase-1
MDTVPASSGLGRLLIVDGHAYAYRAFFAIRQLNSPVTGKATNAIYGFIKMLAKMQAAIRPSHLAVVWDGGLAAERIELLPEYKEQRAPMPDDLEQQLDQIIDYLRASEIHSFCRDGVEADDWIATLARQAERSGFEVIIASSDKDFMQLVSPRIGLLNPHDKSEKIWSAADVKNKTGVEPRQIVDWLSLIGDTVDNIPGVPGVGPKTAADLLRQFDTLDNLLNHMSEVKSPRLRSNLEQSLDSLLRNQKLIRLKDDMTCDFSPALFTAKSEKYDDLRQLYAGWGFKTLLMELDRKHGAALELFGELNVSRSETVNKTGDPTLSN